MSLIRQNEWAFEDLILGTEEPLKGITAVMSRVDQGKGEGGKEGGGGEGW